MTSRADRSGGDLVRALVRSARGDAPRPGAKGRALARLAEAHSGGAGRLGGPLVAAAIVVLMLTGFAGASPAPRLASSPVECRVGIEAPPGSCEGASGEADESSGAASAIGSSSSGVSGSQGSSSG
jgi:hypothetical protein